MKYFLIYLLLVNIIGFLAMFLDKWKAQKNKWRIPEKTLFLLAVIGGSFGTTLGMNVFHHKTKHWYFKFGMPLIFIIQVSLFIYLKTKFF